MKDAVIILGGAFNPVHTQHLALLCLAKEELEKSGAWRIVGGYLAVATDGYVRHKLAARNERTMKIEHRLALVKEAMKDIPWLRESPFQDEMLKRHDGSAFELSQRLMRLIKDDRIQILILVGGDRMVKKGVPIWRRSLPNRVPVIRVGVGRMMDEDVNLFQLWRDDLQKNLIPHPNEYLLLNIPLRSVSSSLVRTYLHRWFQSSSEAERTELEKDLVSTHSFLHAHVLDYIKLHRNDLYIDT